MRPIYIPRALSTGSCITHLWWRVGWPASFRRLTRKRTLHLCLKQEEKKDRKKAEIREEDILGSGWNMQGYILSYPGENLHWQLSVPNSEGPICERVFGTPLWERKEEEEERERAKDTAEKEAGRHKWNLLHNWLLFTELHLTSVNAPRPHSKPSKDEVSWTYWSRGKWASR